MNRTRVCSPISWAGLALLAACFAAGHANAQVVEGKFTLPFQAELGQATLSAGDYTYRLDNSPLTYTLRVYQGTECVGMFLAESHDEAYSGRAELTVVKGRVRSLRLPSIGVIVQYTPHHPKHLTAPQERELAQLVPVTLAGN